MIFSPRIRWKPLADLARRMAISTESGIDVRKSWTREAQVGPLSVRRELGVVRDAVLAGDSISDGLRRTGETFPRLFREMVDVGERTGSLAEVYRRLADHYEHQVSMRRHFVSGLIWPMFQLSAAIVVVGLLIFLMGLIAQRSGGEPIDMLGFGLIGAAGLRTYALIVGTTALVIGGLVWATLRGVFWAKPLQRAALFIPGVGGALRTLCLARLSWSLHLMLNVEMDLRSVLPLALRSTGNDYYVRLTEPIMAEILDGHEIHEAFDRTGAFPYDFLSVLAVGEESGQLVESMGRLTRQYEERAQHAMALLTRVAGFVIWAMVAALIVVLIFRLFSFYVGAINDAMKM